jgi:HTH-type transcriptional regulator, competence development regulator
MNNFGNYIRKIREDKLLSDKSFSLRQVAYRLGVEPSYLSKVERGDEANPSEAFVKKICVEFSLDENVLLAMVGKISTELKEIILKNPVIFAQLLESLKNSPDNAILRIVREVKDGSW